MKDLDKEFLLLVKNKNKEIQNEIKEAKQHIKNAIKISEKFGVPFKSELGPYDNDERTYFPKKFLNEYYNKDKDLEIFIDRIYEHFKLNIKDLECAFRDGVEEGWDYWSFSSMTC